MSDLPSTVAPCGLVCGLCANASPAKGGCVGCASGGGDVSCEQRTCSTAKGIVGCWDCADSPCEKGYFAASNTEWRGMCVASIQAIRDQGVAQFAAGMAERFPQGIEYGEYRHKSPGECASAFCNQRNT